MEKKLTQESKKIKIQIKHRYSGAVLFEIEKENNTIRDAVIEAVKAGTDITGADLRRAILCGTNLREAILCRANLYGTDLNKAELSEAILGAKEIPFIPMACPTDGVFTGWKKVIENGTRYLVKLEIPEDARRSSATGRKCRCNKAMVLEITDIESGERKDSVHNNNYKPVTYKVGEMVYPDKFDDNRWNECSHGIHFFIKKTGSHRLHLMMSPLNRTRHLPKN